MTDIPHPVLSVVIPVWNGERYLAEAITSVLEQQGAPTLEVIVVDDGSEDQSAAIAKRLGPPVRCIRTAHGGLAAARNAGLDLARGEYLVHLDADDLLPPASIASRMAAFRGPEVADLVVGQMISFISPDLDDETAARYRVPADPQRGGLPGATIVRAAFAAKVGRFDEGRAHSPDLDWMARAMQRGPRTLDLPAVVLHRRIHGRNMSLTSGGVAADRLAVLRSTLARKRAGSVQSLAPTADGHK